MGEANINVYNRNKSEIIRKTIQNAFTAKLRPINQEDSVYCNFVSKFIINKKLN